MRTTFLAALALAAALPASGDLFIVRHAEKKDAKEPKSLLSEAGLRRAQDLSRVLKDVSLKAVYCTEYDRTLQTATPTASAHALKPIRIDSEDVKGLAAQLKARGSEDVLVVGHSDTIPDLLVELGVSTKAAIGADDFDNLFIVASSSSGAPSYHRLRY